jgi:hypothetical protein
MMTPQHILDRQEILMAEMSDLMRCMRAAVVSMDKAPLSQQHRQVARELIGARWNERAARGAIGVLVRCAIRRTTLTYTDLHHKLVEAGAEADIGMMQKYARPLDRICLALSDLGKRTGQTVPLLTVLVVNMRSHKPSPGLNFHLEAWLRAVEREELAATVAAAGPTGPAPQEAIDFATRAVFDFTDWNNALAAVGLTGDPLSDMARAL